MAQAPNRALMEAITVFLPAAGPRSPRVAPGCDFLLAAFDQAALAAIFAVGQPLGLAADQPTQPAKSHRVRIPAFSLLHQPAPSETSRLFEDTKNLILISMLSALLR
jgi:hypothetical protein